MAVAAVELSEKRKAAMSKLLIFSGLGLSVGSLVFIGFKKYNELQGLKLLKALPGNPAITLGNVNSTFVDGSINLLIDNPTDYDYEIKNFQADIQAMGKKIKLGALRMAEAKIISKKQNQFSIYFTVDLGEVLDTFKNIFFNSTATVFLSGTVTYVSSGIKVPYPFSYQVDLKDQLLKIVNH